MLPNTTCSLYRKIKLINSFIQQIFILYPLCASHVSRDVRGWSHVGVGAKSKKHKDFLYVAYMVDLERLLCGEDTETDG